MSHITESTGNQIICAQNKEQLKVRPVSRLLLFDYIFWWIHFIICDCFVNTDGKSEY